MSLLDDLRDSLRQLVRQPRSTLLVLLVLALGIGANGTIFSAVNGILLRPFPYYQPDRLVWVWAVHTDRDNAVFSIPAFYDYQTQGKELIELAGFASWGANLSGRTEPVRLGGLQTTANLFQLLGVTAAAGRLLEPHDELATSPAVVVISYQLWQHQFGGDDSIIGRALRLNGREYTVIGILPKQLLLPIKEAQLVVPLQLTIDPRRTARGDNFLRLVGRLKGATELPQAQSKLTLIASRLQQQYPDTDGHNIGVRIVPLSDQLIGGYQSSLWLLMIAVAMVLLISCLNLINLLLARAVARQSELAIRLALGAQPARLFRQLLLESLLLAAVAGLLGLLLTSLGIDLLITCAPTDLPRVQEITIDRPVLLFIAALSLLTGLLCGLANAYRIGRLDLNSALKASSRTGSYSRLRAGRLILIAEVAGALVLLIGMALLCQSWLQLQRVKLGFQPANLLVMRLSLPKPEYANREKLIDFSQQLTTRLSLLPGVRSIGAISVLPLSGLIANAEFSIVDQPVSARAAMPSAQYRMVSPGYFETMQIPLLSGREFSWQDGSNSPAVTIISETLAHRYWPNRSPVGARVRILDDNETGRELEIIGVVGDVKQLSLADPPSSDLYLPFSQVPAASINYLTNNLFWVVRGNDQSQSLSAAIAQEVHQIDQNLPASNIKSLDQMLADTLAARRFNLWLVGSFALIALLLAASGIAGLLSYSIAQRRQELAIRRALGAEPRDLLWLVCKQGLKWSLLGILMGLAIAGMLTWLISSLLFGISALDPLSFLMMPLILLITAGLASYLPARAVIKIDPMTALRPD